MNAMLAQQDVAHRRLLKLALVAVRPAEEEAKQEEKEDREEQEKEEEANVPAICSNQNGCPDPR